MKSLNFFSILFFAALLASCSNKNKTENNTEAESLMAEDTTAKKYELPAPHATKSVKKFSKVIGWPENKTPIAPEGFVVSKFADGFKNPRWLYLAENGDVFVSEANTESKGVDKVKDEISGREESLQLSQSANRITLLRDTNKDGKPDLRENFLSGLNQPFGMLILNDYFYVANTDGLWRYPYKQGQTKITQKGEKILELPAGGYNNHWTRNLIANKDGSKILISVGSASNNGEHGMENEIRRACIIEINPDGTGERIFAYGLRNPVGMDYSPSSGKLWTAVNERDDLGDDLVPDYLAEVRENGFYGWPYTYFGNHPDPSTKAKKPDSITQEVLVPEVKLEAHSASLGLAFYDKKAFPEKYHNGAFVGQHGSWNRSDFAGYKIAFVPFQDGRPSTAHEDFLTGFIADRSKGEVYGRPVGVFVQQDGSLLVTDDVSNVIWLVRYTN